MAINDGKGGWACKFPPRTRTGPWSEFGQGGHRRNLGKQHSRQRDHPNAGISLGIRKNQEEKKEEEEEEEGGDREREISVARRAKGECLR